MWTFLDPVLTYISIECQFLMKLNHPTTVFNPLKRFFLSFMKLPWKIPIRDIADGFPGSASPRINTGMLLCPGASPTPPQSRSVGGAARHAGGDGAAQQGCPLEGRGSRAEPPPGGIGAPARGRCEFSLLAYTTQGTTRTPGSSSAAHQKPTAGEAAVVLQPDIRWRHSDSIDGAQVAPLTAAGVSPSRYTDRVC